MPGPEDTQPSTTPDQTKDAYGTTPDSEREMKTWNPSELKSFWKDTVNSLIGNGETILPYTSPTGDKEFQDKVNQIMRDYLEELKDNPRLAELDVYNHTRVDNTMNNPTTNAQQAGDPVNLFNGDFVYSAADFRISGAGMDCLFTRSYSQLSFYNGPLGFNWDHSYNLWLRIDDAAHIIYRSTGTLSEELFRKHEEHDYWVPPDGANGIILENGDSFVLRLPDGSRIIYQPHQTLHPSIHVVARIEDRFGNHLNFLYSDGLLTRTQVNHPNRVLDFQYDTQNRITSIRDFSGRMWRYDYDDLGDLVAMTLPATSQHRKGLTTCYEYTGALNSDANLQHNLVSIIDADGQLYLENEYCSAPNLLSYRRVMRQRQGNGDIVFDYADVIEDFDFPYETHERPTHQTIVTERDGKQSRYLFNRLGNMILKEEYARIGGLPRLVSSHYRYNRDGNLVGMISPLGVITQALYGRDIYERQFLQDNDSSPETDPNLTPDVRLRFDNLLSIVKRGRYHDVNSLNLADGLWSNGIFPDVLETSEQDVVQKFTYEPEFSHLSTVSDPRFTRSPDPAFTEDAEYHRRLMRYSYSTGSGFQHMLLASVELPRPVLPDGTLSEPVITRFAEYDENGRLIKVIAPNGLEMLNSYAQPAEGLLEGFLKSTTIDPGGFDIRNGVDRDQLGRVVKSFRPNFFDSNDERFFSTYAYNELSQLVQSTGTAPLSISTRYSYDRAGNISRSEVELKDQTNTRGGKFSINSRFDQAFNLVSQQVGDTENRLLKKKKTIFDRAARPSLSIAPSGRKRRVYFNERSLVSKTVEDFGGVHATTRGHYDADGRLVRIIDPRGSVTRFAYDALGRITDAEDAKGNRIIRHYDKIGSLLVECLYEKVSEDTFVLLSRREFSYDELGRMIVAGINKFVQASSITAAQLGDAFRESGPGELLTHKFFYDNTGNIVRRVDQDGREFVSEFDSLGRVTRHVDPNGDELRLRYDKEGNVLRIDTQEVTRDPVTDFVTATQHFAEVFAYDELNRLIERKTSTGSLRYKYDSRGNQVEIEDPLGNRIENTYDIFCRLIETRRSFHRHESANVQVPVRTLFTYDLDDQKITQTDGLGRMTRFQYDSAGRPSGTILPDVSSDSFKYDRLGNLTEYRDRNGLIRHLEWDELNRNTTLRIDATGLASGAEFAGAVAYRCEHDALGRFKTVENEFVITRLTYNSLNHLLKESTSFTEITGSDPANLYLIQREYANNGALIGLTYPSGREIRYSRDILDRIVKIEQVRKGDVYPGDPAMPDDRTIAEIDYEGLRIKRISRSNGTTTKFKYDFGGRTMEIGHTRGSQNVLTLQFLYDALGNMRQKIELAEDFQSTESFKYDSLSRLFETKKTDTATLLDLSSISTPGAPLPDDLPDHQLQIDQLILTPNAQRIVIYNYDLVGNRTARILNGVVESYETNELDQYTKVENTPLLYDENGNLVADATFVYAYDHRNQLAKIGRKATNQETRFLFDYFGRRCLQKEESQSKIFLYDGHNLIEQYDEDQLTRSVVSTTKQDDLLISSGNGSDFYLLSDLTGSIRYLFDGADKHNFYIYDEFGNIQNSLISADDNPFRFAGKRVLGDTGKYDFIYRTYDPSLGKFIQRDPEGFVDGTNLYVFVGNNPLRFADEFGTERKEHNAGETHEKLAPLIIPRVARSIIYHHPTGPTLPLSDYTSDVDMAEYKKETLKRTIGSKSGSTDPQRDDPRSKAALKEFKLRDPKPSPTHHAGHRIDLQHDLSGRVGFDWRDYRWEIGRGKGNNLSRGPKNRWLRRGIPTDVPAGGVARKRDANKFWNRQGYRTGMRYFGYYNLVGGTFGSLSSIGDDIREGNIWSAAINTSAYLGGAFELGGQLAQSPLLKVGRFLGAPAAVVGAFSLSYSIGTNLYENYLKERAMSAGEWFEEKTRSRVGGALGASAYAVVNAIHSAPEAAYDYAVETWTLDPDEIDFGRMVRPWEWF